MDTGHSEPTGRRHVTYFKSTIAQAQKTADAMAMFTSFTGLEINAKKSTATINAAGKSREWTGEGTEEVAEKRKMIQEIHTMDGGGANEKTEEEIK